MPQRPPRVPGDQLGRPDIALEEYVGDLYRALGYEVTRDVELQGNQIDLVAKKTVAGLGHVAVMIEVKHRTSALVSKEEVNHFLETASRLLGRGTVSKAVMVTNTSFTRHARAAADGDSRIELTDVRTIARNLMAAEAPLAQAVRDFSARAISKHYIPLGIDATREGGGEMASSETLLEMLTVGRRHIVLLADYGAGKTTTLERLKVLAAEQYLAHRIPDIPLFFRLRDYSRYGSLEDFIAATVRSELQMDLPLPHFWTLLSGGQFLILLDGFDEISATTDESERADYLVALSPLLFGFSPSILSTRPSYFINDDEYRSAMERARGALAGRPPQSSTSSVRAYDRAALLSNDLRRRYQSAATSRLRVTHHHTLNLQPLTNGQIDGYLATFTEEFQSVGFRTVSHVRRLIDGVYDLSDLMTRPIILDMIVATVLHGDLGRSLGDIELGPAFLYEAYTDAKLAVDWDKAESRQHGLTVGDRKRFAEECALFLHVNGVYEVPLSEAREIAAQFMPKVSPELSREQVLTDLRTCSFLSTGPDGSLRFVHKSFQEFFLSRRLHSLVVGDQWTMLHEPLPREVCYFLGGYMVGNADFRRTVVDCLAREIRDGEASAAIRHNVAAAVLYSGRELHRLKWRDISINGIVLSALDFVDSSLHNTELRNIRADRLGLFSSELLLTLTSERARLVDVRQSKGSVDIGGPFDELRISDKSWLALGFDQFQTTLLEISGSRTFLRGRGNSTSRARHLHIRDAVVSIEGSLRVEVLEASDAALLIGEAVVVTGPAKREGRPDTSDPMCVSNIIGIVDGIVDGVIDCRHCLLVVREGPTGLVDRTILRCLSCFVVVSNASRIVFESAGSVVVGLNWSGGDLPRDTTGLLVDFRRSAKTPSIDQPRPSLFHVQAPEAVRDKVRKVVDRFRSDLVSGNGIPTGQLFAANLLSAVGLPRSAGDSIGDVLEQAIAGFRDSALKFRQLEIPPSPGS